MNKNTIVSALSGLALVLSVLILLVAVNQKGQEGPTPLGGGFVSYESYNVTSADASATVPLVIRKNGATIGSITIASSSPTVTLGIRVYDSGAATSSGALITTIRPDDNEQTFGPLDIAVRDGITLDVPPGYAGSLVITYR